jgi:hypothetical protein
MPRPLCIGECTLKTFLWQENQGHSGVIEGNRTRQDWLGAWFRACAQVCVHQQGALGKTTGINGLENVPRASVINSAQRLAKYFAQY